jgi:hypothetical protein
MELKAPIAEIDDIQLSGESHDALPHANQPKPVALRNNAAVGCSASIVLLSYATFAILSRPPRQEA